MSRLAALLQTAVPASLQAGVLGGVLLSLLASPAAHADPGSELMAPRFGWGMGLGSGVQSRPYTAIRSDARVLPILTYESRWLRLGGLGGEIKLGQAGPVALGLGARLALDGYKPTDAPVLAGMARRKGGLWLGPTANWRLGLLGLSAELLGDASRQSRGRQARLGVETAWPHGQWLFSPRLVGIWRDARYNDHYFGVSTSEQQLGRPAYSARAGTDIELGFRALLLINQHHSLMLDLSQTALSQAVRDSPLVDRSSTTAFRLGYLYRF